MLNSKWLKVGSLLVTAAGFGVNIASEVLGKKTIVKDLAESQEVKDLIAKEVAKALGK